MAAADLLTMSYDRLDRISVRDLAKVVGGADASSMIQMLGGLIDKFGGKGKGSQLAGMLGPIIQKFSGLFGSSPGAAPAPGDGDAPPASGEAG